MIQKLDVLIVGKQQRDFAPGSVAQGGPAGKSPDERPLTMFWQTVVSCIAETQVDASVRRAKGTVACDADCSGR